MRAVIIRADLKSANSATLLYKVKAYDETLITLTDEVIDHVVRKHPETLSLLGLTREELIKMIRDTLEKPGEVHVDAYGSKYFLKRVNDLYINVIVAGEVVRTAYLISPETHSRMGRTRWLRRLY